jgi:hypothetical protein
MARAEQSDLAYLFRLRMTANVKRSLERAMHQSDWADAGQGWQCKETSLRLAGWSRQRRIILLRRKLARDLAVADTANAAQPLLDFAEIGLDQSVWEYAALVTSLDSEILTLGQLYRDRADCENGFDELKNQWGWLPGFSAKGEAKGGTMSSPILSPLLALVLWTFVMCGWLYATRIPAIRRLGIVYDPQRMPAEFHAQLPASVRWKADNYNHLLEQPTIFYAVALTLAFIGAGSGVNVVLAWIYVGLRVAHSLVQVLINAVLIRFALFMAATLVLLVMTLRTAFVVF